MDFKLTDTPARQAPVDREKLLEMAATAAAGYFAANPMPLANVAAVINTIYAALERADGQASAGWIGGAPAPAVAPGESVSEEYIVCLDCGAKLRSLKAHLRSAHGLTPTEYRAKWALPGDYPLVAPRSSRLRSTLSTNIQKKLKAESGDPRARRGGRPPRAQGVA